MSHRLNLLVPSLLMLLVGCSGSTPPAATTPPKVITASTQDSVQVEIPPALPSVPSAAAAQTAATKPADEQPANGPGPMLSREELLVKIKAAQQRGMALMSQDKLPECHLAFLEAGKFGHELKQRFGDLTRDEKGVLGMAFYNEACSLAMTKKVDAAFPALKEAFDAGFADLGLLDRDTDLVAVRALSGYEAWRKEVEAAALKSAQEEVRRELADFKSYPFDFTLNDLDDKPVRLADFKGKVVIADIWGTWCPPCRAEIPSFVKLQEKYGDKGLQIVGLNYERGEKDQAVKLIRDFQKEQKMNYLCLLGDDATRQQVPNFEGYPTTLFIDRTGKVRLHYVGLHPYATLDATVTALLEEPAP